MSQEKEKTSQSGSREEKSRVEPHLMSTLFTNSKDLHLCLHKLCRREGVFFGQELPT